MADTLVLGIRFGLYVALGLLFGLATFALYGLRAHERSRLHLKRLLPALSIAGIALSAAGLGALGAAMAGVPLGAVDAEILQAVATLPGVGTALIVRLGLLLLLLAVIGLTAGSDTRAAIAGASLGGAALATLAWGGHAAAGEGATRALHLLADIVHLLSAGAWIGALAAFVMLTRARGLDRALAHRALTAFSTAGSLLVGMLLVSAGINGWIVLGPGGVGRLSSTPYGRALLLKLGLFAGMLTLAALNRFRLVPRLASGSANSSATAVRRSVVVEAMLGVAILAVAARLGMLAPPSAP